VLYFCNFFRWRSSYHGDVFLCCIFVSFFFFPLPAELFREKDARPVKIGLENAIVIDDDDDDLFDSLPSTSLPAASPPQLPPATLPAHRGSAMNALQTSNAIASSSTSNVGVTAGSTPTCSVRPNLLHAQPSKTGTVDFGVLVKSVSSTVSVPKPTYPQGTKRCY
jgi:hypothetical protein